MKHSNIQTFKHSNIQTFKHSNIQTFKHSIILSFYHSIKQSSNQAIKQSSNQATLSCFYNYFYHFYKRSLKNPLLFIIPPFINPCINPFIPSLINPCHNIFKPFDSISPIFQSVGLTELNLIQGEDDGSVRRFKGT
ncbi:hypothetical protein DDP32_08175 [Helicobacter pylori]|nr:hypothetical protein DDP32_08175 [Helicobacter pylori]